MPLRTELLESYIEQRWPGREEIRTPLLAAWSRFHELGLDDSDFVSELISGEDAKFWQRLWELNLGIHYDRLELNPSSSAMGPDFRLEYEGKVVWVEAVCPDPEGIPAEYLRDSQPGDPPVVRSVPVDEILLRWTSGLYDKKRKFNNYEDSGLVSSQDCQVIAINGCRLGIIGIPMREGITTLPWPVEAVLPIGPFQVSIARETGETVDSGFSYRNRLPKPSGAEVSTDNFFDPGYAHISAVIGSHAHLNQTCGYEFESVLVHNPNAAVPLPEGILGATTEYRVEDHGDTFSLLEL